VIGQVACRVSAAGAADGLVGACEDANRPHEAIRTAATMTMGLTSFRYFEATVATTATTPQATNSFPVPSALGLSQEVPYERETGSNAPSTNHSVKFIYRLG